MSSEAGPSKIKQVKSKSKAVPAPSPPPPAPLSKETVDDSDEDMSDDSDVEASSDDSADSEGDLEAVQPKRKSVGAPLPTARGNVKSLPRFVPPPGLNPVTVTTTYKDSPFEYDRLAADPSLELWAIRLPSDFKPTRLSSLSLSDPSSTFRGTLQTRHATYDLVPAGVSGPTSHAVVDTEGRQPTAGPGLVDSLTMRDEGMRIEGGSEMGGGMRLMIPRVSAGWKLHVAPIPIKRHLLLTPRIPDAIEPVEDERPLPSFLANTAPEPTIIGMDGPLPSKRTQPTHLLKFRNRAFGFDTPGPLGNNNSVEPIASDRHKRKSETAKASPKKRKTENSITSDKKKKVKA